MCLDVCEGHVKEKKYVNRACPDVNVNVQTWWKLCYVFFLMSEWFWVFFFSFTGSASPALPVIDAIFPPFILLTRYQYIYQIDSMSNKNVIISKQVYFLISLVLFFFQITVWPFVTNIPQTSQFGPQLILHKSWQIDLMTKWNYMNSWRRFSKNDISYCDVTPSIKLCNTVYSDYCMMMDFQN